MKLEQIAGLSTIQGITEFLPISSSGHLILFSKVFNLPDQGVDMDIAMHVGSLLAVLLYFIADIKYLIGGSFDALRFKWNDGTKFLLNCIVGTIPAIICGFFIKDFLEYFRSELIVGVNLVLFGIILYVADKRGAKNRSIKDMGLIDALFIGICQVLAFIPGTSRSGITITGGLFLGFKRDESARFSMILSIPAIIGAASITLIKDNFAITKDMIVGVFLTFIVALITIWGFMAWVKKMSYTPFVIYRVILGGILIFNAYIYIF